MLEVTFFNLYNDSNVWRRNNSLFNDSESYGNKILVLSFVKSFTIDTVFKKQSDRVVQFIKNIFEAGHISTTKYPASVMMFGVVEINGK